MNTMTVKWVGSGTEGSRRVIDHHRAHPQDALVREIQRRAYDWDRILAVDFGQKERQG